MSFGKNIRQKREALARTRKDCSVRQVAARIGVEPSYLSKIERDIAAPPSEATIRRLAEELHEDPDVLLAMAGKVSSDLRQIIQKRPRLFADLIRQLKDTPDHTVLTVVREVRDGQSYNESADAQNIKKPRADLKPGQVREYKSEL